MEEIYGLSIGEKFKYTTTLASEGFYWMRDKFQYFTSIVGEKMQGSREIMSHDEHIVKHVVLREDTEAFKKNTRLLTDAAFWFFKFNPIKVKHVPEQLDPECGIDEPTRKEQALLTRKSKRVHVNFDSIVRKSKEARRRLNRKLRDIEWSRLLADPCGVCTEVKGACTEIQGDISEQVAGAATKVATTVGLVMKPCVKAVTTVGKQLNEVVVKKSNDVRARLCSGSNGSIALKGQRGVPSLIVQKPSKIMIDDSDDSLICGYGDRFCNNEFVVNESVLTYHEEFSHFYEPDDRDQIPLWRALNSGKMTLPPGV